MSFSQERIWFEVGILWDAKFLSNTPTIIAGSVFCDRFPVNLFHPLVAVSPAGHTHGFGSNAGGDGLAQWQLQHKIEAG